MAHSAAHTAYASLETRFAARHPKSKAAYDQATTVLPGGNTRTVLFYRPFPLSIAKAHGSRLHDVDGHEYVDFLGEYTAGLYGHSEPVILQAIEKTLVKGLSFGSHHGDEVKLAILVKERFPSMDLLRFTNSGTEATLMALAAAKVFTGRSKVLVFANAYHGGAFSFGGGKSSPVNAPHDYLIATYNDFFSVAEVANKHKSDLAVILVEPMLGSGGAIPADLSFLRDLREYANKVGAVLIFDEVMTSRMHRGGGIQSQLPPNLWPDMTTLGKYFGGGLSFGAFGGKQEIMSLFDPRRPNALAHAGTFNNNVLTMAAGRVGLERVFTPQRAEKLHNAGDQMRTRLNKVAQGTLMKITGTGSIMCFHFTRTPLEMITSHKGLADVNTTLTDLLHLFLLEQGVYIARRGFVALTLALSSEELDVFATSVEKFVEIYRYLLADDRAKL